MTVLKWFLIVVLTLAVLTVLAGQLGWLRSGAPADLGVNEGKLKRPSKTPNSVSSQAELWPGHPQAAYAQVAPLALVGGSGTATLARLQALLPTLAGATVVSARDDYLYASFSTPLMKFTDDVEFWFDPAAGVVQVRSASRLGRKDFGVNRARVEMIRARLAAP